MTKHSKKLSVVEQEILDSLQSGSGLQEAMAPLMKRVMEAALEGEMDGYLSDNQSGNYRNDRSKKQLKSSSGTFELATPRDRNSEFEPQIIKKRVPEHVEKAVVALAVENPALGQLRASQELLQRGIVVSSGGVRSIWLRHELETMKKRLKALESKSAQEGILLTEDQIAALEKMKSQKEAHGEIETHHPGYLGSQDTYFVGTMKGVGRIYQQTFIDTYSRVAHAKLYMEKTAITAADMLNDRVIPFFDEKNIDLLRILTDRGTEYCGKVENHSYQLYLAMEDIDHSRTKANHPQTNGICERFGEHFVVHKTMKQEFYDIAFRKKIYSSVEELQIDVDHWIVKYNEQRPHSGKHCYGKTPMQTFQEAKHLAIEKTIPVAKSSDSVTNLTSAA